MVLANTEWQAVGYRLPVVALLPTGREDDVVGHLGPDVLDEDFDADEAVRRLATDPAAEVGLALLDQRNLAGLGNLYRTEVLFLQGLTPWVRIGDVTDLPALVRRARRLLMVNRPVCVAHPNIRHGNVRAVLCVPPLCVGIPERTGCVELRRDGVYRHARDKAERTQRT